MDYDRHKMREEIAAHLDLSSRLEEIAKKVLKHHILIDRDVAKHYGVKLTILSKKIWNKICKERFYEEKPKFDLAIKEIIEEGFTQTEVARKFGIYRDRLSKEVDRARVQGFTNYAYDKIINPCKEMFTYLQEESLLDDLINWNRRELGEICTCQICALEKLSTLAYEFAQSKSIPCPSYWTEHNRADINWLKGFEMRHSDAIYIEFEPCCWKEPDLDC